MSDLEDLRAHRKSKRLSSFDKLADNMANASARIASPVSRASSRVFRDKAQAIHRGLTELGEGSAASLVFPAWVLFGASGWWSSNAIFAELPLFVVTLPGGEKLGSQLAMMTQLGNFFLVTYKALEYYDKVNVSKTIHAMMASGVAALISCAFFWDTLVNGESLPLLGLMVMAGGVGCMSNATYWAFVISYPAACTKAVGIGMSAGGVLTTSLVALQLGGRPAGRPRFGARVFFALAAGLQGVCWAVVLWMQRAGGQAEVSRAGALQSASEGLLQKGRKAPCGALDQADNIRDPSLEHCDGPRRMPHGSGMACALNASSFFLHAATYTLPSLLPFAASAYPGSDIEQQLLLWMLVFQQGGETLGRVMAPVSREWKLLPRLAAACAPVVFVFFLSSAVCPQMLAEAISVHLASKLLPVMCLGYYFSYGVLQTFMFIQAHSFVDDKAVAERIASNMGFLGQLGSLVANILTFTVVNG
mmetsp:Transcript_122493/g.357670  ORF Transcript_122493/g.357670 Transcript_122493/m.357670 type:complete len:475 (-) Transcript_122493:27-1451(-)